MESVGQILRNERLRQLLTLEEVSASTRISFKNLDAIENDDLKQISSQFFYRSFVRQFADRLGLEFSTVSAAVESSANSLPRALIPGEDGAPLPRVPALRLNRKIDSRWVSSVATLVLVIAGCTSVSALWHASKSAAGRASIQQLMSRFEINWSRASSPSKPQQGTPQAAQVPDTKPQPTQATPEVPLANSMAPDSTAGFQIEVSAIERTWLSIVSDGRQVYSGILKTDESKTLEVRESARIKTGNAGGVDVVFNGKEIGTLGPKGQIRTVVFTKNNYEIVDPSEHAVLSNSGAARPSRVLTSYRRHTTPPALPSRFRLAGFRRTVE
jgi:cytoskeletal protein RodZ